MNCPNCASPMAVDQRYCLGCGLRRAEARLPFLEILRSREQPHPVAHGRPVAPGVLLPPAPPALHDRLGANGGLIAGVGVLLLAMLVGVLIGSAGDDVAPAVSAAPPQVISVAGGAPAAVPTGATGQEEVAEEATEAGDAGTSPKKRSEKASKAPAKARSSAVQELDQLTGAAREKAVEKLGKAIPTGGAPPKKDAKPAAGGGDFEEIG